jgi:hypothetical protein
MSGPLAYGQDWVWHLPGSLRLQGGGWVKGNSRDRPASEEV